MSQPYLTKLIFTKLLSKLKTAWKNATKNFRSIIDKFRGNSTT